MLAQRTHLRELRDLRVVAEAEIDLQKARTLGG